MIDKLKKFFANKITMIVEGILILVGAAGLTIAGVSADGITKYANVGIALIGAVDAIVTMIAALFKSKKE